MCSLPLYFETASHLPTWLVAILFGVPFVGGIALYAYKTRHARSWRKGVFPQSLKPTEDNFLEAYLALGAKLMLLNHQETKSKTQFINQYFNRYFRFANYNFSDSLLFSLKYPIQTKTITDWMKIHLKDEGSRSQVIYFLTGLALVTGEITSREVQLLKQINEDLDLSQENLRHIFAIYEAYKAHQKETSEKVHRKSSGLHLHTILGVEKNATKDEIKAAYRRLVKLHHPDNFATGTESQQKMAAEKFIEIQNAYEALLGK